MAESLTAGKRQMLRIMDAFGCLPDATDGPILEHFDAYALGAAIEQEAAKAGIYGWSKITLHMDLREALVLASHLKGGR